MTALFDYDSILYKAVYHSYDYTLLMQFYRKYKTRELVEFELVERMIDRLANIGDGILLKMESDDVIKDNDISIDFVEYYITVGSNIRKEKYPSYKAKRQKSNIDKWVSKLRERLLEAEYSIHVPGYEADDVIAERAKELGITNCIIVSLDKDLQQIAGLHYNYYSKPWTESDGIDEFGNKNKPTMKGFNMVNEDEARYLFWIQMLTGDATDNVEGINGIGKVKAEKILSDLYFNDANDEQYKTIVLEEYRKYYESHNIDYNLEFEKSFYLLKLGYKDA